MPEEIKSLSRGTAVEMMDLEADPVLGDDGFFHYVDDDDQSQQHHEPDWLGR